MFGWDRIPPYPSYGIQCFKHAGFPQVRKAKKHRLRFHVLKPVFAFVAHFSCESSDLLDNMLDCFDLFLHKDHYLYLVLSIVFAKGWLKILDYVCFLIFATNVWYYSLFGRNSEVGHKGRFCQVGWKQNWLCFISQFTSHNYNFGNM